LIGFELVSKGGHRRSEIGGGVPFKEGVTAKKRKGRGGGKKKARTAKVRV